jgi:hypothetical protein
MLVVRVSIGIGVSAVSAVPVGHEEPIPVPQTVIAAAE